ncbi:MAG TPA: GDSL-type esterase/lipase family protein [Terriglobia bacterium]|nr:GDSL-type esterase/lipase family protein [Terriglobia bacterium]
MKVSKWCLAVVLLALGLARPGLAASRHFVLQNGERVLFYGDSITEQRYYAVAVEAYVRTRFPNLDVKFRNSAVGGARVTGNWTAPVDLSLSRDVFPFKPDIVTIMLGMNDGSYRPFDPVIFNTYKTGYEHIIESLQAHLPGVKIVLIEPTPWDDITLEASYPHNPEHAPGGYDSVMRRYSQFVRKLGAEHHLQVVDFHTPLVKLMEEAKKTDPALMHKIIPGRVHPGASTELVMAQTLLKAWNAPAVVSDVQINASASSVKQSENASVTDLSAAQGGVSWTETDKALPYPIMTLHSTKWPQFPPDPFKGYKMEVFWEMPPLSSAEINPVAALVTKLSGMYEALDNETLRVSGLEANEYALKIDGKPVGTFSREQLASGINLARYDTPMMEQAYNVMTLVWHRVDVRFYGWRAIQVPLGRLDAPGLQDGVAHMLTTLDRVQDDLVAQAHSAAQPQTHHYELSAATQ